MADMPGHKATDFFIRNEREQQARFKKNEEENPAVLCRS